MASISATNSASALRNLQAISKELTATQGRISTGLKVTSARDDASVWATAQNIRADIKKESTVSSGLTLAKGRADVTVEALDKVTEILTKMKDIASGLGNVLLADAGNAQDLRNQAISAELDAYQTQLTAIVESTAFEGANWMKSSTATPIVLSTNDGVDTTFSFAPEVVYDAANASKLRDVVDLALAGGAYSTATADKAKFDTALTSIKNYTAKVAGLSETIGMQQDFVSKISSIRQEALSALVDADMTVESAKLSALQVREQLTYQTLAMINQSSQNVLRLFQ